MLDYSGSMNDNGKYVRMTAAAQQFIEKVAKDRGDRTKIGIVPFSEYVLATVPGGMIRGTPAADANTPMTTCLLNRDYPYSTEDATPTTSIDGKPLAAASLSPTRSVRRMRTETSRVRDLTNDFDRLKNALSDMRPTGAHEHRARVGDGLPSARAEPPVRDGARLFRRRISRRS